MKTRFMLLIAGIIYLFSLSAFADAASELQRRLSLVKQFHAQFSQTVTDNQGSVLQKSNGELWVQRPDLFNWTMHSPDESLLISDGKMLWFYNPLVEQVTIRWLKDSINDTPFILIARNNASDWEKYRIEQNQDVFNIRPNNSSEMTLFQIHLSPEGNIKQFQTVQSDGQRNVYALSNQNNSPIPADRFYFTTPKNVTIDDQRQ